MPGKTPPPRRDPMKLGLKNTQDIKNVESAPERQLYADPRAAAAEAVDKIAAARVWLMKEKPFFGILARAFQIEPSLKTPAFRLRGNDKLDVNPIIVLQMRFPALCARLSHLAMHAALSALLRRGERDARRWNVAHDLAIDPLLRAAALPSGIELPALDLPHGASADEYYARLPEGTAPDPLWCDLCEPPPIEMPDVIAGTFTRQDDGEGKDPGGGGSHGGDKEGQGGGEGEGDQNKNQENDSQYDENEGEDLESGADAVPLIEARSLELQWKMRLNAAMEEEIASGGKTFGERPGFIDEWVRATVEPPPDWTATLSRSVSMLTRSDRSFLRPSRRMSALAGADGEWPDVVAMPGRKVQPSGKLVVVIDTSASIRTEILSRFLGSVASVASAEGFDEVRLVQADAEVTKDETLQAAELLFQEIEMVGRGGTDFGPAIRMLAEESKRMGERYTLVYLTDLDGRFPEAREAGALEILWVVPGKVDDAKKPPVGQVVEMGWAMR